MSDDLYRFRGHKVKVTRADSFSTVSGLKLKGFFILDFVSKVHDNYSQIVELH